MAEGGAEGSELEPSRELESLRRQLQDKTLELEKEIALRKLLNSQKDEQARRLRSVEHQLEELTSSPSGKEGEERHEEEREAASRNDEAGTNTMSKSESLLGLLRAAEERGRHLEARLHGSETEAEGLRLAQLRQETASSARVAAQSADLMKRLSAMQREREKVLTTQLRVALKERQEALEKAGALVGGQDVAKLAADTELSDIFSEMRAAKDSHELKHHGAILIAKMRAKKEEFEKKVREQLDSLCSEKEAAEQRARELSQDVAQLQRRLEVMETEYRLIDKTRVKALQTQLEAVTQERDYWHERTGKLEDTVETLRILNSLQKSLKKEEDVKRTYELELQRCRAEAEAMRHTIEEVVVERNMAIVERNQVVKERNELAVKAQQEFDRAEQLHRIVTVLRKKTRSVSISSGNT